MLAWSKRGALRSTLASPVANLHSLGQAPLAPTVEPLKLLTFNIQVGIRTAKFSHYLTKGWKHLLPHEARNANLRRIADLVARYEVVLRGRKGGARAGGFTSVWATHLLRTCVAGSNTVGLLWGRYGRPGN